MICWRHLGRMHQSDTCGIRTHAGRPHRLTRFAPVELESTPLDHSGKLSMLLCLAMEILRLQDNNIECTKNLIHFPICACHPCAGAMLIFSASFQFYRMFPEGNPHRLAENEVTTLLGILQSYCERTSLLHLDIRDIQCISMHWLKAAILKRKQPSS